MENDIFNILNKIRKMPNCSVHRPCGLPILDKKVKLPDDLRLFYENCGGVSLFINQEYGFEIVNPKEMVLANPIIIGEPCDEDISSTWYIICKDFENNYITIDLAKERIGRCYDSFWDRHGVVGECSIVARNFTELVNNLMINQGKSIYWLENDFIYIGDAYDDI